NSLVYWWHRAGRRLHRRAPAAPWRASDCAVVVGTQGRPDIHGLVGDLKQPDALNLPPYTTLYCTAYPALLANALPRLLHASPRRVIAFSPKQETEIAAERKPSGNWRTLSERSLRNVKSATSAGRFCGPL